MDKIAVARMACVLLVVISAMILLLLFSITITIYNISSWNITYTRVIQGTEPLLSRLLDQRISSYAYAAIILQSGAIQCFNGGQTTEYFGTLDLL